MIEGFKVQFTTAEMGELLEKTVSYHLRREMFYNGQAAALREEREARSSGDPYYALDARAKESHSKAAKYEFLRAHLVPDEIYLLRDHEAMELVTPEDGDDR